MQTDSTALEIVCQDGKWLMDSRVLATRLGYDHKIVLQSIRRHKARLEARSLLLHFEAKPLKGSRGGRPEQYYMLDERQSLILTGSLKKGEEADEWHDRLVDAFLQARDRVNELENQQSAQPQKPISLSPLADRLAATVEQVEEEIPEQHFAMATEMHREVRHTEILGLLDHDATAFPEISVGRTWASYVRSTLGVNTKNLPKYKHTGPGLKCEVYPRCYPIELLGKFRVWFRTIYLPEHCPIYVGNRKKRLERQARVAGTATAQQIEG